jgi:hypothetical protein
VRFLLKITVFAPKGSKKAAFTENASAGATCKRKMVAPALRCCIGCAAWVQPSRGGLQEIKTNARAHAWAIH